MVKHDVKGSYLSKEIAEKYDQARFSHFIGRIVDRRERKRAIYALELCGGEQGDYVCDIACGTGRITESLVENGFRTIGIDYSLEMLKVAKTKKVVAENAVGLCVMDAHTLAFKTKVFDFSTSLRFFGHIPKDSRVAILKDMARVTKGNIVVAYYGFLSIHTFYRFLRYLVSGKFYGYTITKKFLKEEVSMAGLRIKSIHPMMRFIHQGWIVVLEHV
jgi:ubiquinone/menaquinone biosynthesis C-methylase UbiE